MGVPQCSRHRRHGGTSALWLHQRNELDGR
nr:MAG TPA: hypothetical protein [Caudoviricetes sp.]DAY22496.1 MAG TPA: hypothetical protein [Caudoviricetes sp.]